MRRRLRMVTTGTILALTVLSAAKGINSFMGHQESWYNLPMENIIERANLIYGENPYWIREDGVKMYGPFVICAGTSSRYGEVIDTSLGKGLILDTGDFVKEDPDKIDIATAW